MDFIDTINGYDLYKYSPFTCSTRGCPYPTYACFMEGTRPDTHNEECSCDTFEELAEWCENN